MQKTISINITDAQQVILRALLSMAGSAIVGTGQAMYQYMTNQGHVDIPTAVGFMLGTFGMLFSTALYAYIPAHHAEALQAANDTALQAEQAYTQLQQSLLAQKTTAQPVASSSVQETSQNALGPLVVMHVNGTPATLQCAVATDVVPPMPSMVPPVAATPAIASMAIPARPKATQLVSIPPDEHPPVESVVSILPPVEPPAHGQQELPAIQAVTSSSALSQDTMPRAIVGRQVQ